MATYLNSIDEQNDEIEAVVSGMLMLCQARKEKWKSEPAAEESDISTVATCINSRASASVWSKNLNSDYPLKKPEHIVQK